MDKKISVTILVEKGHHSNELERKLMKLGYHISSSYSLANCSIDKIMHDQPDIILIESNFSGEPDESETVRQLQAKSGIPIINIIDYSENELNRNKKLTCGFSYLFKPYQDQEIYLCIEQSLYINQLEKDLKKKNQLLEKEISEHKKNEEQFRVLFEYSHDLLSIADENGQTLLANSAWEKTLGYTPGTQGNSIDLIHPDDKARVMEAWQGLLMGKSELKDIKYRYKNKKGYYLFLKTPVQKLFISEKPRFFVCTHDITESKTLENHLKESLQEKEVLLKEIHHRVKNNMQTIISLLRLKIRQISDEASKQILTESENKIYSMAIVHETLYQNQDLAKIDMNDYIRRFVFYLFQSMNTNPEQIQLKILIDPVFLPVDMAIPLGLIINELVCNALKYAFPQELTGEIQVQLQSKQDFYELIIRDNGIGLAADLDSESTKRIGLTLVKAWIKQIGGAFETDGKDGTRHQIQFKVKEV